VDDLPACGVAISNACWREQVGELGTIASSGLDGGTISASGGERLRVGKTGRLLQSL